jgi:UDP-glucose 4-epimerase
LSAVYGPRIKGNYQRLVHGLASGRFVPLGPGTNRRSLVFEDDAAAAFVAALQQPAAAGRVFNVSDGTAHRLRDIIDAICAALGRRAPTITIPVMPAMLGVRIVEQLGRLAGRTPPITSATLSKYLEDSVVDSGRIVRELGYVPRFDLATGWRLTVEALRASGALPPGGR